MSSSNRSALARNACLAVLLALAVTGCATGYGSRGITGGYSDERIDDTHYVVSFNGNGYASKDRVWYFWFYRCAELTAEKGFTCFDIDPVKKQGEKHSRLEAPPPAAIFQPAVYHPAGGAAPTEPAGYQYYTTTVTTWSSSAVVSMFAELPKGKILFNASRVLELLGPYVQSNGSDTPLERKALLRGAVMRLGQNQQPERVFPDGKLVGFVDMGRFLDGVAEGKAARARLKASFAKKQAQLEAAKAQAEKVKRAVDAERAPARKASLQADLDARVKGVKELRARLQAEVEAEEERAIAGLAARVKPVIERVRTEQHLDGVTDQGGGALCDDDVTAEVIRLYDERYGAPGTT